MCVRENRIWAFDFDGTLSCLVADRNAAVLDPACAELLEQLAGDPGQVVAVVSSRRLEDIKSRIHLENVVLAGSSGLEWWIPGGQWLGPNQRATERLQDERKRLLPSIGVIGQVPGVEIEDKCWSAAIHFRQVAVGNRSMVERQLEYLRSAHGASLHYGPEVAEVQFLAEVNKEIAVRTLVKLFGAGRDGRNLIYAGDDQNDAKAMSWVLEQGGSAYVVGHGISPAGAIVVADPPSLALAIRRNFPWIGLATGKGHKEVANE